MTTTAALTTGTVVTYHGSIGHEVGNRFYIHAIADDGRLTLLDPTYPTVGILRQVRPASVRPTGDTIALCACGHEAAHYLRSDVHYVNEPTVCGTCGWACTNHTSA